MKRAIFAIVLCFVLGFHAHAQRALPEGNNLNPWSFGIHGGVTTHFGDIKMNPFWPDAEELRAGTSLHLDYHISPVFTLSTRFTAARLAGLRDVRSFETSLMEGSLNGVVRINQLLVPRAAMNNRFNFYVFGGLGMMRYDAEYQRNNVTEQQSDAISLVIPLGAGLAFRLGERVDMYIESGNRFMLHDELDAFVGHTDGNDVYNFTSVGLAFRLGPNTRGRNWSSRAVVHRDVAPAPAPRLPEPPPSAEEVVEPAEEPVKEEPVMVERTEAVEVEEAEGIAGVDDNDYFVIVGSFRYRGNAERLMLRLRGQGFNSMILRSEAGMFRVSINAYHNQQDARSRIAQVRSHFPEYHDAWLLIRQR